MRVFKKSPTARKFTIEIRDHLGIARRFAGLSDKRQTEQMGRRIEALVACRCAGVAPDAELTRWLESAPPAIKKRLAELNIIDPSRVSAARPLRDLIEGFCSHLEAKERTRRHVNETRSMLLRLFDACGFRTWSDITPGKVETTLKDWRDSGLSVRRSNGYLTAAKSFAHWMVNTGQAGENPLRSLHKLNEKTDVRRRRRAATADELRKLIAVTATRPEAYGMSGAERALLYRLCAATGLRANEVRHLTAGDFDLDRLVVRVPAGYSKHRETDTIPLREDLAEALREHLRGKLPTCKAFGGRYGKLTDKTAAMLRQDLQAAGIPYSTADGYLDFHSLRHTFITGLSHAPSRVAQRLARHKSSAMTDRYTHIRLHDERAALELLPDLTKKSATEAGKQTGTDGRVCTDNPANKTGCIDISKSGARIGAPTGTIRRNSMESGAEPNRSGAIENAVLNAPGRTRTCGLRIRNPLLCPAELRALEFYAVLV